ncbi:hypothetical protein [Romboutsia sp.]|uniref:hypothetical protein n=1 Tax=Romboutsia sp. TaxID=1965302 RepID=UPI002C49342D|nr:hypothetical protein [Romboutsia sp.]HSQ88332.1 hypothetical protein [Romboutsia sp.]
MLHSCERIDDINRIVNKTNQNTDKIILLEKNVIRTNMKVGDSVIKIDELKNLCFWILGLLITLLITIIGSLTFLVFEFSKLFSLIN